MGHEVYIGQCAAKRGVNAVLVGSDLAGFNDSSTVLLEPQR